MKVKGRFKEDVLRTEESIEQCSRRRRRIKERNTKGPKERQTAADV